MGFIINNPSTGTDPTETAGIVQVLASGNFDVTPAATTAIPWNKTGKKAILTAIVFTIVVVGGPMPTPDVRVDLNAVAGAILPEFAADCWNFPDAVVGGTLEIPLPNYVDQELNTDVDVLNVTVTTPTGATIKAEFIGYWK